MTEALYLYGFVRDWWRKQPLEFDENGWRVVGMPDVARPFTALRFPG